MKAIFIQARLSSKRFPGKMLNSIGGIPLVKFVYERCKKSSLSDIIAVITSKHESDDSLVSYCKSCKITVFRGPLDNVLERYILAAEHYSADLICRVCGDSPFVDTELLDRMFELIEREKFDYVAPDKKHCIAGLDSEMITLSALKRSFKLHTSIEELEHTTLFIRNNLKDFASLILDPDLRPPALNNVSLTIDYPEDLIFCNKIFDQIDHDFSFTSKDILDLLVKDIPLLS
jgi:spore coat polysaccharide biosynthesis protein SpsF (cytidylyltransferase family)